VHTSFDSRFDLRVFQRDVVLLRVAPLVTDDFKQQVRGLAGWNLRLEFRGLVIVQLRFEQAAEGDVAGPGRRTSTLISLLL
jgi:hypothetical protein